MQDTDKFNIFTRFLLFQIDAVDYHRKTVEFEVFDYGRNFHQLTFLRILLINSKKVLPTTTDKFSTDTDYVEYNYTPTDGPSDFSPEEYFFDREDVEPLRLQQTRTVLIGEETSAACSTIIYKSLVVVLLTGFFIFR